MDQEFDRLLRTRCRQERTPCHRVEPRRRTSFDKPLLQDEARLRELFMSLQHHGTVLIIVDQPNTIGALSVAVAPGLRVRSRLPAGPGNAKSSGSVPGDSKDDARDAFIIAETDRAMPHTLRAVDRDSEVLRH